MSDVFFEELQICVHGILKKTLTNYNEIRNDFRQNNDYLIMLTIFTKEKNLVWLLHDFPLSYITTEQHFTIRLTFIYNFTMYVLQMNELLLLYLLSINFQLS